MKDEKIQSHQMKVRGLNVKNFKALAPKVEFTSLSFAQKNKNNKDKIGKKLLLLEKLCIEKRQK